jgi:hypothetical protein
MPAHPCEGLSRAATGAFNAIAVGLAPRCSEKTLTLLLDRGLVEQRAHQVRLKDGLPPTTRFEYWVPYPHHIQWCNWGADSRPRRRSAAKERNKRSDDNEPEPPL